MRQTVEITMEEFKENKEEYTELTSIGNAVVFYREKDHTAWIKDGKEIIGMATETMYRYVSKLANKL